MCSSFHFTFDYHNSYPVSVQVSKHLADVTLMFFALKLGKVLCILQKHLHFALRAIFLFFGMILTTLFFEMLSNFFLKCLEEGSSIGWS